MTNRRGPQRAACTDTGESGTPRARRGEEKVKIIIFSRGPPGSKSLAQRIVLTRVGAIALDQLFPLPGPAELAHRGGDHVPRRRHYLIAEDLVRLLERAF